jgi:hypothetical protein
MYATQGGTGTVAVFGVGLYDRLFLLSQSTMPAFNARFLAPLLYFSPVGATGATDRQCRALPARRPTNSDSRGEGSMPNSSRTRCR